AGRGDDTLTGGGGTDSITGGLGTDWVIESADADFALNTLSLTIGGTSDFLSGIERAQLTGGASANLIDASLFSGGGVILIGGGGLDTLKGGSGDDELRIDVAGLTAPTNATDT